MILVKVEKGERKEQTQKERKRIEMPWLVFGCAHLSVWSPFGVAIRGSKSTGGGACLWRPQGAGSCSGSRMKGKHGRKVDSVVVEFMHQCSGIWIEKSYIEAVGNVSSS